MDELDDRLMRWRAATQGLGMPKHVLAALETEARSAPEKEGEGADELEAPRPKLPRLPVRPRRGLWLAGVAVMAGTGLAALAIFAHREPAPAPAQVQLAGPPPLEPAPVPPSAAAEAEHVLHVEPQPEAAFRAQLEALRATRPDVADELEKTLTWLHEERQKNGGWLVAGRVVLDGAADPETLEAQMRIHRGGWFVTLLADWNKPLQLASVEHGLIDVSLTREPAGRLSWLGELRLERCAPSRMQAVSVMVTLEGRGRPELSLVSRLPVVNTPGQWREATTVAARRVRLVRAGGDTYASEQPVAPGPYFLSASSEGHATVHSDVEVLAGVEPKLPPLRLETLDVRVVRWLAGPRGDLGAGAVQQRKLKTGERFRAAGLVDSADFQLEQREHSPLLRPIYSGVEVADLGPGALEDFREVSAAQQPLVPLKRMPVVRGHVYLIRSLTADVLLVQVE